jgi:hypothetical protein
METHPYADQGSFKYAFSNKFNSQAFKLFEVIIEINKLVELKS